MIKIPQTLANQVSGAINALLRDSARYRDWNSSEVQSIIPEIAKLQKVDAREAFCLLGSLAALCGERELVFEHFKKALLLPDQAQTKHEFWVSLGNAALYRDANELGKWLLDPKRGFFLKIWERAVGHGQIQEVWNRLSDAKKLYPEELAEVDFSLLSRAVSVMNERGLSDENIVSVLSLMGDIHLAHRIMYSGRLVSILKVMRPPEDPPYLYLTVPLDANVIEIHAMNRELAKLVIEKLPDGAFPLGVVTSFAKSACAEELSAAA